MPVSSIAIPTDQLARLGLNSANDIHYQSGQQELVMDTLRLGEGVLSDSGALVVRTGEFTGRSPKDKFIVKDGITASSVHWNQFNIPIDQHYFDLIAGKLRDHLNTVPELWVRDCSACADPRYRLNIRLINAKPWSDLFAHNMFLRPAEDELEDFEPDWHILSAPCLKLDPEACGVRQHNATVISFRHKMILIAGSGYTGEIKKGIFSVLNFLLPRKGILSMHCSANTGDKEDTALFFGLSGTGKTTLSADPSRKLIGDDEHGWSDDNIFNFEGGCYAKTIDLDEKKEPGIYHAIRAGALVENTDFIAGTSTIDFTGRSITENTRVSYPIDYIGNALHPSIGNIPSNIFFLTCDAYGVLPPLSRLSPEQAMYHFISGYTAKVAGTETGIREPSSTFSACFGAPFMPLHPGEYAAMLGEKMRKYRVKVWMVNTGWTGGPYGKGSRIALPYTRAMISSVLEGRLDHVSFHVHPVFGMDIPFTCPGVPDALLDPQKTWNDREAYDRQARQLAGEFISNFKNYEAGVDKKVAEAGPAMS